MTQAKLPYHRPTLESLGSIAELTQTGAGGGIFDGAGYVPDNTPPGS